MPKSVCNTWRSVELNHLHVKERYVISIARGRTGTGIVWVFFFFDRNELILFMEGVAVQYKCMAK